MLDTVDLGDEIALLSGRLNVATHRLLTCIRSFDELEGWHRQGAQSCAHWLVWRIGIDPGAAREKVRAARALGALPKIDEAFAAGKLSYSKVRAVTRTANPKNEESSSTLPLLRQGRSSNGSAGDSGRQPRTRSWQPRSGGFAPACWGTGW